jgi:hypothetical protein
MLEVNFREIRLDELRRIHLLDRFDERRELAGCDCEAPPGGTSAHMHDFFGNRSTDASSTYNTMTATSVTTTCSRPEDTAGYWIPTVSWKDQKGTQTLTANRAVFYYRAGSKDFRTVQPFAKNLRIIADKDVNGARVRWYCGGGGSNDDKAGSADPRRSVVAAC